MSATAGAIGRRTGRNAGAVPLEGEMHYEITFEGAGVYWLTNGHDSMPLGRCEDEADLAAAVQECMDAGDADWSGWYTSKDEVK